MDLRQQFLTPPDDYRPVPFWWWVGEPLTKERLAWQLDQLRAKGVLGAIISYNHNSAGLTDPGDPPLFSLEWWDLFRWTVSYCKQHGMKLGFKDYTIINPVMQEVGRQSPEMAGCGSLRHVSQRVSGAAQVKLAIPTKTEFLAVWAFKIENDKFLCESALDLIAFFNHGELLWQSPAGEWEVVLIAVENHPFDPTHPSAGAKTIEALYGRFEKECPGEVGQTIKIFFQDELNFFQHTPSHLPLYSPRIAAEFKKRKGYDVGPWLPALWHDLGSRTAKVRIDYNDVTTALMEEHFFIPIFRWCDERGVMLAQDNHGRGRIVIGHKLYGDYFRTMRWYHAPGTEDPGPQRGDAFKGFKINSSIAHLYRRPRVWNEAFHSSGWGITPAQIIAGFDEDCAYGATFLNLHGLYYTTYGSWWEWAPPDFHFRQPYWEQLDGLSDYTARMNYLLSQGVHQCDVAIVYPITTIEAGLHAAESESEKHAFSLGRHLFDAGIDFDFIDFESIERAEVADAQLQVSGERYRVLLFPMMGAVRYSSLEKARAFARAGGTVIFFGCRPQASDQDTFLQDIPGEFVPDDYEAVKQLIEARIVRDFIPSVSNVYGLHRQIGDRHVYFVFNREDQARDVDILFRAKGTIEQWDAWTGESTALAGTGTTKHGTLVRLHFEARQGQLVVFSSGQPALISVKLPRQKSVIPLDGSWDFELQPTMDNQFGDFRQPAVAGFVGAEACRFHYCDESAAATNWQAPEFDDAAWEEVTYSFGPRLWKLGPLAPGTDMQGIEAELQKLKQVDPAVPVIINGQSLQWTPYSFSLRWGLENGAGTGPHGLRGTVPDDFIDLGRNDPGSIYFMWAAVNSSQEQTVPFVMGSGSEYTSWLNGNPVLSQNQAISATRRLFGAWQYDSTPRETTVKLTAGSNPLLLRFVIPPSQFLRAHAVFNPPKEKNRTLGLRWFTDPSVPVLALHPSHHHAGLYRFKSPPGLAALIINARGPVQVWVNNHALDVQTCDPQKYRAIIASPSPIPATVAIRVEQPPDSYAGDSLPEPIQMTCVTGQTSLGDWSQIGLACYSGGAWYRKTITLTKQQAEADSLLLQLGQVACAAEVHLNGALIAKKIVAPWSVELAGHARTGENQLKILVTNTLANHYSVGVPSGYVYDGQTKAGLFGPVQIEIGERE